MACKSASESVPGDVTSPLTVITSWAVGVAEVCAVTGKAGMMAAELPAKPSVRIRNMMKRRMPHGWANARVIGRFLLVASEQSFSYSELGCILSLLGPEETEVVWEGVKMTGEG